LIFSKKCITEFFDNGLGASFKRTWRKWFSNASWCRVMTGNAYFEPTRPCELGPGRNFNHLSCASTGAKKCLTKDPPADGTCCGNNKWFLGGKCGDVGVRPDTVNGQWGEWWSWPDYSRCSWSCGSGASYIWM
jgi:hypothetical protein